MGSDNQIKYQKQDQRIDQDQRDQGRRNRAWMDRSHIYKAIYIRRENFDLYLKLEELATRENQSFNTVLINAMEEYVARHYPGNPQKILNGFLDVSRPLGADEIHALAQQNRRDLAEDLHTLLFALDHLREIPDHNLSYYLRVAEKLRFLPLAQELVARVKNRLGGA